MVKLEIFSGDPPCPGCVAIIELAERVAATGKVIPAPKLVPMIEEALQT